MRLYQKGKGRGVFKKTRKEKEEIATRIFKKWISKQLRQLTIVEKKKNKIECEITERILEQRTKEKLKELEEKMINDPNIYQDVEEMIEEVKW